MAFSSSRLDGGLADAARRHVDDPQQRDLVARVGQHLQVGQHVADLLAVVERHAADQHVGILARRSSISNARGCSLVRQRMAKSLWLAACAGATRGGDFVDHGRASTASSSSCRIRGGSPSMLARSTLAWRSRLKAMSRLAQATISRVER